MTTMPIHNSSRPTSSGNTHMHAPSQSFTGQHPPPAPTPPSSSDLPTSPTVYSPTIRSATDNLIHLFNAEISQEIQITCAYLKAEREKVVRERNEIEREREAMRCERENWRKGRKVFEDFNRASGWVVEEEMGRLRVENQALKIRIQALQVEVDKPSMRGLVGEGLKAEP